MNTQSGKRKTFISLFCSASLVAAVFLLYAKNLSGYWRADDPQILLQALKYSWWEYFFIPGVWQTLSLANLTPWVTFSFDLDLHLFDIKPFGFYLHHLVSVGAVAVATFFLLSLRVEKHWAYLGALLFLVGAPVETVTHNLMTRHYIEGLLFSILSVYCFVRYKTDQRYRFIVGSLIFYTLAISAKEIYVPLAVLLIFVQRRQIFYQFKKTLPLTLPFLAIALIYIFWRHYMLNSMLGVYGENSDFFSALYWSKIFISFAKIPALLLGEKWLLGSAIYLVPLFFCLKNTPCKVAVNAFVFLLLVLIPLVPLADLSALQAPNRFLFLFWYSICCSFSVFSQKTNNSKLWFFLGLSWVLLAYFAYDHSRNVRKDLDQKSLESDVQLRFFWDNNDEIYFVPTDILKSSMWTLTGLAEIKIIYDSKGTSPKVIVNDMFLPHQKADVFAYSSTTQSMIDISSEIAERRNISEEKNKENVPLYFTIKNNNGLIEWQFGPYTEGIYEIFSESGGSFNMSATGVWKTGVQNAISFYLQYNSLDGWITRSPLITLPADGTSIRWSRSDK